MRKLSMDELNRPSVEAFKNTKKNPFILLLDNVRSAHNVGSAFRTADAFAVEKIMLCGITATPPNREIAKTALGATESIAWEYSETSEEAVKRLRDEGYLIVILEQTEGSINLNHFTISSDKKYCFVFGNEVFGVDEKLLPLAEVSVEIPQFGTKHSLNISVSVGIVLWECSRQLLS
ncbi:RNA methyltransferase [Xanthocytophaga agilis]|uniref:RNA methyltransferase n=1 Tax=Xanthocytophaga agilis TaxID=3048010 RepID=A0AAE3UJ04_9BACT|nr:RNA methyltransferase [Xanthocytophaga agilis]MDJ1504438.1 RNA methyltransferase [Xanthocytophaga agilis]